MQQGSMAAPMQAQMVMRTQMQMAAMMQMQMQMQLGAMAQMQQMQQMQMLPGMMPMMPMPMAPMMPMVPAAPSPAAAEKAEEDAQLALCSLEDMTALEQEVKELEQKAKSSAKLKDGYVGLMARYIEDEGFGFISCPECKDIWDKTDIFVSGRTFMASGIDVGDMVAFTVEKDGKDLPRAVSPKTLDELTKLRKRLTRMREVLRSTGPAQAGAGAASGIAPLPPSLKRPSDALLEAHMLQGPGAKRPNLGAGPRPFGS